MIKFNTENRFAVLERDIYCVSVGTQTNCGGIAAIVGRMQLCNGPIRCSLDSQGYLSSDCEKFGDEIPIKYQSAVFDGVKRMFSERNISEGFSFFLVGLLIHAVDSNIQMNQIAGRYFVKSWLGLNPVLTKTS